MTASILSLADLPLQAAAEVVDVRSPPHAPELADRLAEIGFLPGEPVRVMVRAAFGGDPLAVRVCDSTFALRRAEAECVQVRLMTDAARARAPQPLPKAAAAG